MNGNLNVYIPGHGQSAVAARNLLAAIVALSPSQVVWSIDIDPPRGGDAVRAKALIKVIRSKAGEAFGNGHQASEGIPPVTAFGWSHGAIEAMLAAEKDRDLIQQVVCLCPAGLVEYVPGKLLGRFVLECLRVFWNALLRSSWAIPSLVTIGCSLLSGVMRDSIRSRSLQRAIHDLQWTARKVVGQGYTYDGRVVILFARDDTAICWRDVFSGCQDPSEIGRFLEEFRKYNFPHVQALQVQVLEGSHMAPEVDAAAYIKTSLDLLDRKAAPCCADR